MRQILTTLIITGLVVWGADNAIRSLAQKLDEQHKACMQDLQKNGNVELTATSPDGTKLWHLKSCDGDSHVYFTNNSATECHTETRGKTTVEICKGQEMPRE